MFIRSVEDSDISRAGILLAKVFLQTNLPANYVAIALNLSRMPIYSKFRFNGLREIRIWE